MAKRNQTFSQTLKLKTELDTTNMLKGLKDIAATLQGVTAGKSGKRMTEINAQIEAMSNLSAQLQRQYEAGFIDTSEVQTFTKQLEKFSQGLGDIKTGLQGVITEFNGNGKIALQQSIDNITRMLDTYLDKVRKAYLGTIRTSLQGGGLSSSSIDNIVKGLQDEIKSLTEIKSIQDKISDSLKDSVKAWEEIKSNSVVGSEDEAKATKMLAALRMAQSGASGLVLDADLVGSISGTKEQQKYLLSSKANQEAAVSKATPLIASASLDIAREAMGKVTNEATLMASKLSQIAGGFDSIAEKVKYFLSFATVFREVSQAIRQTFQDIKQLDKSFTEIAMVTSYHVSELWNSYDQYALMANRLGQATNDVIQASVLYYQQGLKTNEVLQLTEDTMKLATLAGADFREATDLMTAAIRGFNLEMDQGSHVTDVYSELAAHAAASVQEIAVAMNKTASLAHNAGMSLENTSAFLTQMIETTQESATNIGTAMKTIIARFTELKKNVDEIDGEPAEKVYNNIDKALSSVGISLKDVNGQFRNVDDIFLELASKWSTLSRNQQRYIATQAAGSRQQSRFLALMSNYKRTLELVEIAQNSENRSTQQFSKYTESLEYRINQLKNTWEQFRVSLVNSDTIKNAVGLANTILEKITSFDSADLTKLTLIFLTLGKTAGSAFFKGMSEASENFTKVLNGITSKAGDKTSGIVNWLGMRGMAKPQEITENLDAFTRDLGEKTQRGVQLSRKKDELSETLSSLSSYDIYEIRRIANARGISLHGEHGRFRSRSKIEEDIQTSLRAEIGESEQAIKEIQNYKDNLAADARQAAIRADEEANKQVLDEWFNKNQEIIQKKSQAVGAIISTSITAGLTTAIAGGSGLQVLGAGLVSAATAAVPQMVNIFATGIAGGMSKTQAFGQALSGGLTGLAISAGITAVIASVTALINHIEKVREEQLELSNAAYSYQKRIDELAKEQEDLNSKVNDAAKEYEDLSNSYNTLTSQGEKLKEYNKEILLTTEQQEDYNKISNELAETFPSLVEGYDAQGNAIINLTNVYDDLIKREKEELDLAQKKYSNVNFWKQVNQTEQDQIKLLQAKNITERLQNDIVALNIGTLFSTSAPSQDGRGNIANEAYEKYMAQRKSYGEDLKLILQGTGFESLISNAKDGEEVIAKLEKAYTEGTLDLEALSLTIQSFSSKVKELEYNYNASLEALESAGIEKVLSELQIENSRFKNITDKNVQEAMARRVLKDAGVNESDFEKQWMTANPQGEKETTEKYRKRLDQAYKDTIEKIQIDENSLNNFSQKSEKAFQGLTRLLEQGANFRQLADYLYKQNIQEDYELWLEAHQNELELYNKNIEELAKAFGVNVDKTSASKIYSTSDELINKILNIGSDATNIIVSAAQQAMAAGTFEGFKSGLHQLAEDPNIGNKLGQFFNYNWDAVASQSEADKAYEYFADVFGREAATNLMQFGQQIGMYDLTISNVDQLDKVINKFVEATKTLDKQAKNYTSIVKHYSEKGYVSYSDLVTLQEDKIPLSRVIGNGSKLNVDEYGKIIKERIAKSGEEMSRQALTAEKRRQDLQKLAADNTYMNAKQLAEKVAKLREEGDFTLTDQDVQRFVESGNALTAINKEIETSGELLGTLKDEIKNFELQVKAIETETNKDREDNIKQLKENVEKTKETVIKAQQDVIDKQKELDQALYGSKNYQSKADSLYNYSNALELFGDKISEAKDSLQDLNNESPDKYLADWIAAGQGKSKYLNAQNLVYDQAIRNTESTLRNEIARAIQENGLKQNINDFFGYNSALDRYTINLNNLNKARFNDQYKDLIVDYVTKMNEYKKTIKQNRKEIKDLDKEWNDYLKTARDNYISVQEEVVKKLKESYEKEIEDKKSMYDDLKQADEDYISAVEKAINKERQLRDQQNKWNDLATKEKKLSLLQRDTSGAQQKEVLKLQKDIEKDRTSLLDESVDQVISDLKELYSTQQETREAEIEYQKSLLDNSNLIAEANAIMNSWKSMDDMANWMYEHTTDIEKMSDQAVEKLTEDWKTMFDNIQIYNELSLTNFKSFTEQSAIDINNILKETTESLTNEAKINFESVSESVQQSIKSAQDAVTSALKALTEAQNEHNKAIKEYNDLIGQGNNNNNNVKILTQQEWNKLSNEDRYNEILKQYPGLSDTAKTAIYNSLNGPADRSFDIYKPIWEKTVEDYMNRYALQQAIIDYYSGLPAAGRNEMIKYKDAKDANFVGPIWKEIEDRTDDILNHRIKYASGGLVNYTGPAWVDGTRSNPEAFLNPEDTRRIGESAKLLANLPLFNPNGTLSQNANAIIGDSNVEININVDSIATEGQVDYLIDRIKDEIVSASNPIGTNVVLHA